jgi:hypothetical protein
MLLVRGIVEFKTTLPPIRPLVASAPAPTEPPAVFKGASDCTAANSSRQLMLPTTVTAWLGCRLTTQPLFNLKTAEPPDVVTKRIPLLMPLPAAALPPVAPSVTVTRPCTFSTTPNGACANALTAMTAEPMAKTYLIDTKAPVNGLALTIGPKDELVNLKRLGELCQEPTRFS